MEFRFSEPGKKLACFDLDHTLLKPKGNRKFAKGPDDAQLVFDNIPEKLQELRDDGWKIVIFTNQKKKDVSVVVKNIYTKVDRELASDIDIFIAHKNDFYRKPAMGMWDKLIELNGLPEEAFYVGDAAGRENDFSDSDRCFAHNCKIDFFTPEQYFLGKDDPLPERKTEWPYAILPELTIRRPTIIMMVGRQGCGKSSYVRKLCLQYPQTKVVSNDKTGSASKTRTLLRKYVRNKERIIVIDNTHSSAKSRQYFLSEVSGYLVYCVISDLEEKFCRHLDCYRSYVKKIRRIPDVAIRVFNKKYEVPKRTEGFDHLFSYIPDVSIEIKRLWF
jgi:bifunctional polynucleotide phosphatase/kinase